LNGRLKQLRKKLELTQDEFGQRIGITGSAISKLESGASGITEQLLKAICREFKVDYIWLTTGESDKEGDDKMFFNEPESKAAILDAILHTESDFARNVFDVFLRYTKEDWEALEHVVTKSAEYMKEIKNDTPDKSN